MERHVSQLAEVTTSGRTSGYMMKKWLETIFDPYNRDYTPQKTRSNVSNVSQYINDLDKNTGEGSELLNTPYIPIK